VGLDQNTATMDLILGLGAVLALVSLVKSRKSFADADFTAADRRVAMQVSVFLVPPVVVLLHELGHAIATVAVGAHVTSFHYGLFEGSVGFTGARSDAQVWFIGLAGNVVSAGIGAVMVLAGGLSRRTRRSFRYVLIFGGLYELIFALVGYPLISETARFGDWLFIYDFQRTPALSWATLVVHVAVLVAFWRWWRTSLRHTLFAVTHGQESRLAELEKAVRDAPTEVGPRIALANLFAGHGDLKLAASTLDQGTTTASDAARLHLARARLAIFQRQWNRALLATREGLADRDGNGFRQELWANQGVALAQMERPELALAAFEHVDRALADDPRVRYNRALARLGSGDVEGGRADLLAVMAALPEGDLLRLWAEARLSGRTVPPPDDSDRPAWARRREAPQAPITGV